MFSVTDFKTTDTIVFRNELTCFSEWIQSSFIGCCVDSGSSTPQNMPMYKRLSKFAGMPLSLFGATPYMCICHRLNNALNGGFWTHKQYFPYENDIINMLEKASLLL